MVNKKAGFRGRVAAWGAMAVMLIALALSGLGSASAVAQEAQPASADGRQCGMVIYDWDGEVTLRDRGFPREQPPRNNFNWTTGPNYADGHLYYRAIIRDQPVAQAMRLQLCFWQPLTADASYNFGRENCGPQRDVSGEPGTRVEWDVAVRDMWKKDGRDMDWTRPRYRTAVAVKNSSGQPVSNYNGWEWNGERANQWYPLDMRFTTVVVPPGGEFCGWDYYDNPTAVGLGGLGGGSGAPAAALPLAALGLALLSGWAWRRRGA